MKNLLLLSCFLVTTSLNGAAYTTPKENFHPKREIAALYIEYNDQILLLHRQNGDVEGNKWAPPAGHVEKNETPLDAVIRETKEETGYKIAKTNIEFFKTLYIEYSPTNHYLFHMFRTKLQDDPSAVKIDFNEHKGFTWVTPSDALKMNLLKDEDACIKELYIN